LQVAERQGKFLVKFLNKIGKKDGGKAFSAKDIPLGDPFVYKHLGSMASVGRYKALVDLRQSKVRSLSTVVPVKFGALCGPWHCACLTFTTQTAQLR